MTNRRVTCGSIIAGNTSTSTDDVVIMANTSVELVKASEDRVKCVVVPPDSETGENYCSLLPNSRSVALLLLVIARGKRNKEVKFM
jgi:hypothetical protein